MTGLTRLPCLTDDIQVKHRLQATAVAGACRNHIFIPPMRVIHSHCTSRSQEVVTSTIMNFHNHLFSPLTVGPFDSKDCAVAFAQPSGWTPNIAMQLGRRYRRVHLSSVHKSSNLSRVLHDAVPASLSVSRNAIYRIKPNTTSPSSENCCLP